MAMRLNFRVKESSMPFILIDWPHNTKPDPHTVTMSPLSNFKRHYRSTSGKPKADPET